MLERFTKERQRNSRGVNYNLEDEDDLTHYGKSLSALDDFDGANLGLDDDDEERGEKPGLQPRLKLTYFYIPKARLMVKLFKVLILADLRMMMRKTWRGRYVERLIFSVYMSKLMILVSLNVRRVRRRSWPKSWLKAKSIRY